MTSAPVVEIAAQDAAGARIAFDAGADHVDVCQALGLGGLTPSLGVGAGVVWCVTDAGPVRAAVHATHAVRRLVGRPTGRTP